MSDDVTDEKPPLSLTHSPPPPPPPDGSTLGSLTSTLSYFAHPIAYTVEGVLRRISVDDAPTPLARALSANYNGSMTDPTLGVYHPPTPQRKHSPFQPPPLTPLSLKGYKASTSHRSRLLSRALAEEVRLLVPPRLQLVDEWQLSYSLEQDGSTLSTMYSHCDKHKGKRGGFVIVIRDSEAGTFGAYLSDPPKPSPQYYGSGECFLWRAFRLPALPDLSQLPPPPSADTTHLSRMTTIAMSRSSSSASLAPKAKHATNGSDTMASSISSSDGIRFKAFPYSGENDYTIYCQSDYFSVGGGDGHYGLWLDHNLAKGVSDTCPTFGNEPLSAEGKKFDVLGVEVWYIGA
ncbi:hypothetical protein AMS68_006084 [Peltaster fructicola]|uniref:Oxidation resistance protein 1 n=1 Tax=Peltaster fructicola TaxID=286661 RepID=A0A6H0Y0N6_9PEZI|nr:hypothetical protein AMS68_006084 [Peltaster fructicola]